MLGTPVTWRRSRCVLTTIIVQLVADAWLLVRQRRDQERAQELLHVQKWQLEQLVPGSGSAA